MIQRAILNLWQRLTDGRAVGQVEVTADELHDEAQVYTPDGFLMVPAPGTDCLVVHLGNGRGDTAVLMVDASAKNAAQIATYALQPGDRGVAAWGGSAVIVRKNGQIDLFPSVGKNVVINGSLQVTGTITDGVGSLDAMRSVYNSHVHGGGVTPTPTM